MRSLPVRLVFLAAIAAAPLRAEPVRWAMLDGWDIGFYPNLQGCLAFARFDGTGLFIGYDTQDDVPGLDITLLDERWDTISAGEHYVVSLTFGDKPPWTLDMLGVHMDGAPGLSTLIDTSMEKSAEFIAEFQGEMQMVWRLEETELGRFTLKGSRRAFEAVQACQEAHAESLPAPEETLTVEAPAPQEQTLSAAEPDAQDPALPEGATPVSAPPESDPFETEE